MRLTNRGGAVAASVIITSVTLGVAQQTSPHADHGLIPTHQHAAADTAAEGHFCIVCAGDVPAGKYTAEELKRMGPQRIPEHLLNSPLAVVAGGMGPGHEPDPLTIVIDFRDPGDQNSTDIIGNVVTPFDPTIFGFTPANFDAIAQAVLDVVLNDYFAIPDSLSSGSPLPPGTDLACDVVLGDIGTPPSNGATEYYYVQVGTQINGETYLGQASTNSVRNAAGNPAGIANGSIVATIYSNNIQGLSGLDPPNALSSGNIEFTRHALGGTTAHEIGHTVSLRHLNVAGSVTPTGLNPLMATGAIDLPSQARIVDREFSITGMNAQQSGAVKFYIQQLINALGLHQLQTGACCLCDGTCLPNVTQAVCEATDGFRVWADGATCFEANCEPVGACCLCTGLCIENTTQLECLVLPDADRWVECGECATLTPPCEPLGACCLCDGSCLNDVTQADCNANANSVAWFECTDCSAANCEPVGACCLCDGTCLDDVTEPDCTNNPLFVSWNECTDCASLVPPCEETGACCLCDGTCIDDTTLADCQAMPDYRSWTACSDCATTTCEIVGACCLCTGECIEDITQAECLANPLFFSFTLCTDCVAIVPLCEPTGACCLCDGTCQDDLTLAEC
ncbi:MAG: hypothetical protein GY715_03080, partial [Planctomycetes bacterium]|nr:hypothetical protein [Planctomycetota bacterium]